MLAVQNSGLHGRLYGCAARRFHCAVFRLDFAMVLASSAFPSAFGYAVEERRDQRSPTGLMAGAQTAPVVSVKVLVEQNQIGKIPVERVTSIGAMTRTPPLGIGQKESGQACTELVGDLVERFHASRTSRALDFQ